MLSDLDLMEQYPTLAKDFNCLRQELDSPFPSPQSFDMLVNSNQYLRTQQAAIHRRNEIARDLDDILLQIREKPGFENFLLEHSKEFLLSAAAEGPIVVVNVAEHRSDAILLSKSQVTSVALPNASHGQCLYILL